MASSACFDCNICLEFVHEPVVTLCGHLYCWPCLYKWFHFQSTSISSYENPQCPVCKSSISPSTVVPLYGRGEPKPRSKTESKGPFLDMIIPPRPPACGTTMADRRPTQQRVTYQGPYSDFYEEDSQPGVFGGGVSGGTHLDGIQYGMLGDMVYARVFGNSDSLYAYPNMYSLGRNSSRLRWQEMQADKCLNRIYLFLLCCFVLCLIFF